MNEHFNQIAKAIEYISEDFRNQPTLDDVAAYIHMSPFHFQRLFTEWAGVSPKKFLQYTSLQHAKNLLKQRKTLLESAAHTGLSSTGRLHDLFVGIEGMTPGEYKNGGSGIEIAYSYRPSHFGTILVGSTMKGVCYVGFVQDREEALRDLRVRYPNATFVESEDSFQSAVIERLTGSNTPISLHVKGTPFQLKVWEALLRIPMGQLSTYGAIASEVGSPKASRAVGSAIGDNPVSLIIPCHRVIRASGVLGGYYWGLPRKSAILGWEMVQSDS